MTTRDWSKRETQRVIRSLWNAGFTVDKIAPGIYQTEETGSDRSGAEPIFKAVLGGRGYLISHHPDLFERGGIKPAHRWEGSTRFNWFDDDDATPDKETEQ
tara:strand:- start:335 stop:637 length:303 start_codon:yes stop_codon:yes gene_type:complete